MYAGESDFDKTGSGKFTLQEADALMSIPVVEFGSAMMLVGGRFKWTGLEYKDVAMADQDLYVIGVPVDVIYGAGTPWVFWGNVSPGVASDLDDMNSDDYNTTAAGIAMYQWTPNLSFALGLAYDREFGDDKLYPMGGVRWLIGDEWELNAILPTLRVAYAPTSDLFFQVHVHAAGDKWHMRVDNAEYDMKVETIRLGAGVDYAVADGIWLHFLTGLDVDRKYEIQNAAGHVLDDEAEDAAFVRVGLLVR